MTLCRFEDRLAGTALALSEPLARITACAASELDAAFAAIARAQQQGHWIALLLDYALGAWLDPAQTAHATDGAPRLTALVFRHATRERPWSEASDTPHPAPRIVTLTPRVSQQQHRHAVENIQHRIRTGQCYQVNYTFGQEIQFAPSPPTPLPLAGEGARALYRRLATRHPSGHAAYIEDANANPPRTVLSFSPELFVARVGDTLTTRPMKGTAPRVPDDPAADALHARALQASVKNRAENLMITDLLRNDLGRLAAPGSVRVDKLFELERYPAVWTLTSTITARAPQASLRDVLTALFPCGSVTGAPKIAAMRAIAELETAPRGLYCGSLGWLAPNGDFSLNVAIRTLVLGGHNPSHGTYPVGGGIVLDSDATEEWQECQWKSRVVKPDPVKPDPLQIAPQPSP